MGGSSKRSQPNSSSCWTGHGHGVFIPPFMSCNFWGCDDDDDNNNNSPNVANMISDAIPIPSSNSNVANMISDAISIPSSNSNNDDIQLGPVNIPNPVGGSFMGRRKQ